MARNQSKQLKGYCIMQNNGLLITSLAEIKDYRQHVLEYEALLSSDNGIPMIIVKFKQCGNITPNLFRWAFDKWKDKKQ